MAAKSRFIIDLRVGPRTMELAAQLVVSTALVCSPEHWPMLLIDDHRPYPSAILQVLGLIKHRRRCRRNGRIHGRRPMPRLKPPPALLVAVVHKVRDARGRLVKVKRRKLFGRLRDVRKRVVELGLGKKINTSHIERLNGTLRTQQSRLVRRTRCPSRLEQSLQHSLWLWRDVYHWTRVHGSLKCTPAMAIGLADRVWSVREYVNYPVHTSELQDAIRTEQREKLLTPALTPYKTNESLPPP